MSKHSKRQHVTKDVMLAKVEVEQIRAQGFRALLMLLGLAAVVLACGLPAYFLAGETTHVDVSLAVTATVTLTIAGTGVGLWGNAQRRRANRVEQRARDLTRDVKELQQRLRDHNLPDGVSR